MAAVAVWPDRRTADQRVADALIEHQDPEAPHDAAALDLLAAIDGWIDARRRLQLGAQLRDLIAELPALWALLQREDA